MIEDVVAADKLGADMVGVVVEVAVSRRSVSGETAKLMLDAVKNAERAMLTFDPTPSRLRELVELITPDIVHFTGEESPWLLADLKKYFRGGIFKSIHLPPAGMENPPLDNAIDMIKKYADSGADIVVIDTRDAARGLYGGTGKTSDWKAAAQIAASSPLPVLMAGGLNIANVERAILEVRPYGVDLAGGLEKSVGEKDHNLIDEFIKRVREISNRCGIQANQET